MIPTEEQLDKLKSIGFELPDDPYKVFWFVETSGDPLVVRLNWKSAKDLNEYLQDFTFMGYSVKGAFPHFMKR